MVVIAFLPTEFYIISACKSCDRLFVSAYYDTKYHANFRNAYSLILRFGDIDDRMYMIRHNDKHGNFYIRIMGMQCFKGIVGIFA